jgi:glycosyltransferase 2 family protein
MTLNTPTAEKTSRRRRSIWQIASLAISVGLMLWILSQMDMPEFLQIVKSVAPWSLAGALITYVLLNLFRTYRFRTFMPKPHPSVPELMPIVLYHNFLTRVLPFKTGEISYVVLLNRYLKQPVSEGISSLLSARLFELALVILGGAFGFLTVATEPEGQRWLLFALIIGFLIVYMLALYYSGAILRSLARLWTRLIAPSMVKRFPRLETRVEEKLHLFAGQFDRIHNPRLLLSACLLSTLTYSMSMSFDIILMRGLGISNPLGVLVTIISIKMFLEAAPIAVSGFGVIEGGWTFGLVTLAGMDVSTAASIAFFLHVCQVVIALVVGLAGWAILARFKPRQPAAQEASALS